MKSFIKKLLAKHNVILIRRGVNGNTNVGIDRWDWLQTFGIKTCIDVGANKGSFIDQILGRIPQAVIYAFEPIACCYDVLRRKYIDNSDITIFNVAISDTIGTEDFYISDHLPSSSLLEMTESHKDLFPYASGNTKYRAKVERLDGYKDSIQIQDGLLIKLDVQGAEDRVIRGGPYFFSNATAVITEMSHIHLYKDQSLFDNVHRLLHAHGLRYAGVLSQYLRTKDFLPVFSNVLYVRSCLLKSNKSVNTSMLPESSGD